MSTILHRPAPFEPTSRPRRPAGRRGALTVASFASSPSSRRPSRRRLLVAVAAVAAFALALGVTRAADHDSGASRSAERKALLAYTDALTPLANDAGRIIQQGLKVQVADLTASTEPDADLLVRAEGQLLEMRGVAKKIKALRAPTFLANAKALYGHALGDYVFVARVLVTATKAHGAERQELVRLAIDMGNATDHFYELADGAVDRQRVRLGLPTEEDPSR